jgi:cytosine/adenosine deaminase-related metal-dependent hydrolase
MDQTPFFRELGQAITLKGGLFNAHLHLDRSGTLETVPAKSSLSLASKHGLIPAIHESPEYEPERLRARVKFYLDQIVLAGTARAQTLVDVTADRVRLSALETFLKLKSAYAEKLDLQVGAYSPLGFKANQPERWELLLAGARAADFIGSLPERDDQIDYPDHIGFDEHCLRIIALSYELRKRVHIHVDQRNDPREDGTERVIKAAKQLGVSSDPGQEPMIWLVHMISPSTYDEPRFRATLAALAELNIGIICCPSAALSMRQLRPIATPTHNSIARLLEILAAGIHVRLGSDNICDIASPAGTCDLVNEIFVLSNVLRYYDVEILASLATGLRLDNEQRNRVKAHLDADAIEVARAVEKHQAAFAR